MYCYNVLLYLRCSAETTKISLMVFLFMLYCVVEPKLFESGRSGGFLLLKISYSKGLLTADMVWRN